MAKANGGHGDGALEGFHGTEFTPLNATAGTLIKVSRNGDELEPSEVSDPGPPKSSHTRHLCYPHTLLRFEASSIHTLYALLYAPTSSLFLVISPLFPYAMNISTPELENILFSLPNVLTSCLLKSFISVLPSVFLFTLNVPRLINQGKPGYHCGGYRRCTEDA